LHYFSSAFLALFSTAIHTLSLHDALPIFHPMVRSMILHFWLAYDHPFVDGNGRTARALFYWSMLRNGYWMFEYITISKIILSGPDRKSTRLNSSHLGISYAVFCLKKKKQL